MAQETTSVAKGNDGLVRFASLVFGFALAVAAVLTISHFGWEQWLVWPCQLGRTVDGMVQERLGTDPTLHAGLKRIASYTGLILVASCLAAFASAVCGAFVAAFPSLVVEKGLGRAAGDLVHYILRDSLMTVCFVSWSIGVVWKAFEAQGCTYAALACLVQFFAFRLLTSCVSPKKRSD